LHVWTLGVAPYTQPKFQHHFRHNSFFIGKHTRNAINQGLADYTPIFLFEVPELLHQGLVPIDVALIQTSPPDSHGYLSLGISVDIVKAATEKASLIIAQINTKVPRVHGDGFIHTSDVNFVIPYDEPILEYSTYLAKRQGLLGFTAEVISDNKSMLRVFDKMGFAIKKSMNEGVYELKMMFQN
jgi:hypothetical protein